MVCAFSFEEVYSGNLLYDISVIEVMTRVKSFDSAIF